MFELYSPSNPNKVFDQYLTYEEARHAAIVLTCNFEYSDIQIKEIAAPDIEDQFDLYL